MQTNAVLDNVLERVDKKRNVHNLWYHNRRTYFGTPNFAASLSRPCLFRLNGCYLHTTSFLLQHNAVQQQRLKSQNVFNSIIASLSKFSAKQISKISPSLAVSSCFSLSSGPVFVGFAVDKVALGQCLSPALLSVSSHQCSTFIRLPRQLYKFSNLQRIQ